MGCKQKAACLTQRGNNALDCTTSGSVKTCRQCCNGYNCAAKSYFQSGAEDHQTRSLGATIEMLGASNKNRLLGTFWFEELMASDEK